MKVHLQNWTSISKGHLFQFLCTLLGTLSVISIGMHFGWASPTIPQLLLNNSSIPMSSQESSWVIILPCFGGVAGATLLALFMDQMGRKVCLLIGSPISLICWICIAFTNSLTVLYCARFLAGVADAIAFTVFPIYVCEIADSRIRGFLGSMVSIGLLVGVLLINILGSHFTVRTTALISCSLPVLHFVTFLFIPESPYYLLLKNRVHEASESLKLFRGTEFVGEELIILEKVVREGTANKGKFLDLLTVSSNRKAFIILMLVRGVQQFSGFTAITFYTQTIFESAGGSVSSVSATAIYVSVQLLVAIFSSVIVDRAGRKPLLIISIIGSGIALLIEGCYFYFQFLNLEIVGNLGYLPLAGLLGYITMFYVGLGTVPYIIPGELFPINVKAFAMGLGDVYYSLVVALVTKAFHAMKDTFGMHLPFFSFAGCCVVGLVMIVIWVPETKLKTLEEIQQSLKSRKKNPTKLKSDDI